MAFRQQTERAREVRQANIQARQEAQRIPDFDTAFIDTVRELATRGRGSSILNTPVALAIIGWLDSNIARYGRNMVAFVCAKALADHPYIFDSYIYQSDQSGYCTSETLFVLRQYATEYIEAYNPEVFDEVELGLEEDDGTGRQNLSSCF